MNDGQHDHEPEVDLSLLNDDQRSGVTCITCGTPGGAGGVEVAYHRHRGPSTPFPPPPELVRVRRVWCSVRIDLLERRRPALGRPAVDTITGSSLSNLKELRAKGSGGELRVMFIFDPIQRAVLLVGGDKTGLWNRWYDAAIPEAERVYKEYLASSQYQWEREEHEAGDDNGR